MRIVWSVMLLFVYSGTLGAEGPGNRDTTRQSYYDAYTLKHVNSSGLDFCPVFYKDKLIFISERELDLINYGENRFSKSSYLSIQSSDISEKDDAYSHSRPKGFSTRINQMNHNGPITFSGDGNFAVFTRTMYYKGNEGNTYRPRLFSSTKEKGKWKNVRLLEFNEGKSSYAHPCLSPNGSLLYFSSDREGGYGGNDIYVSEKGVEGWGEPKNLGPQVNTAKNEVFPYLHYDGTLYFSSDGHEGLGGLDIFYSTLSYGKWAPAAKLDSGLNSVADDFGIVIDNTGNGYFSSNRDGGEGKDDIYGFTIKWMDRTDQTLSLSGSFRYTKLPAMRLSQIEVYAIDENGAIIATIFPDEKGNFIFRNLPVTQTYTIRTSAPRNDLQMNIASNNGEYLVMRSDTAGTFYYRQIDYMQFDELSFLFAEFEDPESGLLTKSFKGQLTGSKSDFRMVYAVNAENSIVDSTSTDKDGYFHFAQLPYSEKYHLKTSPQEENLLLTLLQNEKQIAELTQDVKGEFLFIRLMMKPDEDIALLNTDAPMINFDYGNAEDDHPWIQSTGDARQFQGSFVYESLPAKSAGGIKVYLIGDNDEIIAEAFTDSEGLFVFKNLPPNKNFKVRSAVADEELSLRLINEDDSFISFTSDSTGDFVYRKLNYKEFRSLALLFSVDTDDDDELLSKSFTGKLTGDNINAQEVIMVNSEGKEVARVQTDEKGNFDFKGLPYLDSYTVRLADASNQIAMIVFVDGVKVAVLRSDNGEFKYVELDPMALANLKSRQSGDVQAAKNVDADMIEFDYEIAGYNHTWIKSGNEVRNLTGSFVYEALPSKNTGGIKVYLINDNNEIIGEAFTDPNGYFAFRNLPPDQSFTVRSDVVDSDLLLQLINKDKSFVSFTSDSTGDFVYRKLNYKEFRSLSILFTVDTDEDDELLSKSFTGKLTGDNIGAKEVILLNSEGIEVARTTSDDKGNFGFVDLPYLESYNLKMADHSTQVGMMVFIDDVKVAVLRSDKNGEFNYVELDQKALTNLKLLNTAGSELVLTDDFYIYGSQWVSSKPVKKTIAGTFKFEALPSRAIEGIKVYLIDEENKIVAYRTSDKNGYFAFEGLMSDRNYVLKTDEYIEGLTAQLLDKSNQVKIVLANDHDGRFLYQELSYKNIDDIGFFYVMDEPVKGIYLSKSLTGQLVDRDKTATSLEGIKVMLVDKNGKIQHTTTTNTSGDFSFEAIPYDGNYLLQIESDEDNLGILIFNEGTMVAELSGNSEQKFVYLKLPQKFVGEIAMMDYNQVPASLLTRGLTDLEMLQEHNRTIVLSGDTKTAYIYNLIKLKESGSLISLSNTRVGLCPDSEGLELEELDDCLDFTIEELMADAEMTSSTADTPIANADDETTIENEVVENAEVASKTSAAKQLALYFDFNSSVLNEVGKKTLSGIIEKLKKNKGLVIDLEGYTDSQGSDAYNKNLSQWRTQTALLYMTNKGIAVDRISVYFMGESNPVASNDNIEGRKLNRRVAVSVYDKNDADRVKAERESAKANTSADSEEAKTKPVAEVKDFIKTSETTFCKSIVERKAVGASEAFPNDVGKVYLLTKIERKGKPSTFITHVWYYGDKEMARVKLNVNGSKWRTYSSKNIYHTWKGKWKVDVLSEEGEVLKSVPFEIE